MKNFRNRPGLHKLAHRHEKYQQLAMQLQAEGKGFEPSTHCWASDFESDRWPIRIPSERDSLKVYQTL